MLPKVEKGEEKLVFIKRCVTFIKKDNPTRTTDEALNTCKIQWDTQDMALSKEDTVTLSLSNDLSLDNKIQEIKIFPKKEVYVEKYKQKIDFNDEMFEGLIKSFKNPKLSEPFMDVNHDLTVSFAELLELTNKEDGLYAKIELNDIGIEAIKNKRYRYISPYIKPKTDGDGVLHKYALWAITMTNIPALEGELPKLQDQIKLNKINKEIKVDYKAFLESIEGKITTFSLENDNAEPAEKLQTEAPMNIVEELLTQFKELVTKLEEAVAGKEVAEEGKEKAEEETAKKEIEKEELQKTAIEATTELSKIKLEKREVEKATFFKDAVIKGQVEMNELELFKQHYDENEEFVRTLLSARPEQKNELQLSNSLPLEDNGLSDEDKFIMNSTGLSVDSKKDVATYKTSQGDK